MLCKIDDCDNEVHAKGWCNKHYLKYYKNDDTYKPNTGLRNHPLYIIWWQRKIDNVLCERWLNFENFIWDVGGSKPEGNFTLTRITSELYGPTNFKWQEHLKRKEGETLKEWHSRKWQARQIANPLSERARHYKRKYGITLIEYEEKLKNQNGFCAICGQAETSFDSRTNNLRRLAVDHNHNTGQIRGLLCWRCNATVGKIEENIDLLDKIKNYLVKHKGT